MTSEAREAKRPRLFRRCARLHPAIDQIGFRLTIDHGIVNHDLAHVLKRGQFIHRVEQYLFQNRAQAARAGTALERLARYGAECLVAELQFSAFQLEHALELLDDRVLRFGEDPDQRRFVEFFQRGHDRQTPDKFGNQTKLDQILGLDIRQYLADICVLGLAADFRRKANPGGFGALLDDLFQAGKRATADEKYIFCINLQEFLLRMLAPALRWN